MAQGAHSSVPVPPSSFLFLLLHFLSFIICLSRSICLSYSLIFPYFPLSASFSLSDFVSLCALLIIPFIRPCSVLVYFSCFNDWARPSALLEAGCVLFLFYLSCLNRQVLIYIYKYWDWYIYEWLLCLSQIICFSFSIVIVIDRQSKDMRTESSAQDRPHFKFMHSRLTSKHQAEVRQINPCANLYY